MSGDRTARDAEPRDDMLPVGELFPARPGYAANRDVRVGSSVETVQLPVMAFDQACRPFVLYGDRLVPAEFVPGFAGIARDATPIQIMPPGPYSIDGQDFPAISLSADGKISPIVEDRLGYLGFRVGPLRDGQGRRLLKREGW